MPIPFSRTVTALLGSLALAGAGVVALKATARGQAAPAAPPAEAAAPATSSAVEPAMIRDGFESARPIWNQEQTDTTIHLLEHDRSRRAAHEGRASEHFRFTAAIGSGFYFSDTLPNVPVTDVLKASLFVRANRAGVQLFARVVLPADVDPETKQPSFLLVPGTSYDDVDHWQRLEVANLPPALERQARVLRATTRRPVSLQGAYVERLVVNLYAGAGETEVFLDELAIGPVPPSLLVREEAGDEAANDHPATPNANAAASAPAAGAGASEKTTARVRLDRNRLKRRADDGLYYDMFPTLIDAPGADVAALRNAGFDVLIDDLGADPARFAEAVKRGFLLLPRVNLESGGEGDPDAEADRVFASASGFAQKESVLAWSLGDHLGRAATLDERHDQLEAVRTSISKLKALPGNVSRLTTGLVDDDLPRFTDTSRKLHLLGIRANAWGGSQTLMSTLQFLKQRRDLVLLGNAGALFWVELPATAPPEFTRAIWGMDVPPLWGTPMVQPEQLRQMTYAALAAGYRGIAYKADAELTRGAGRMALLEMALLNAEIDLCESILANGADPIPFYNAYPNDPSILPPPGSNSQTRVKKEKEYKALGAIRSAAIGTRDRKGVLLVVADFASDSQYQPPQLARNDVNITVIVPEGAQAFEISPGRFEVIDNRERTVGGTRLRLSEFDATALLLVTTDVAMAQRVETVVNALAPRAAAMAIEQAELKLQWVTDINGRLAADGHYLISAKDRKKRETNGGQPSTDQADLLRKAAENIKTARENQERLDFAAAWSEARRATRALRHLQRGLWENAKEALERANTPPEELALEEQIALNRAKRVGPPRLIPIVASPPLTSFNTLPQHYLWVEWMKSGRFGRNLIPSGDFDSNEVLLNSGWKNASVAYEGIESKISSEPTSDKDKVHRRVKMLVRPSKGKAVDRLSPYLVQPAAAIQSPPLPVKAGQFLRISVMILRRLYTPEGAGGVIVRDTIGGEPLQYVVNDAIPEPSKLVLYRRVPADGDFSVTLGLAGYGDVFFDDFRVERIEAAAAPPDVASRPMPRRPDPTPAAAAVRSAGAPRPPAR